MNKVLFKRFFQLYNGTSVFMVNVDSIDYVQDLEASCNIHMRNGDKIHVPGPGAYLHVCDLIGIVLSN